MERHVEWRVVQEKWNCDQVRADVDANEQVDNDRSVGQGGSELWVPEAHVQLSAITAHGLCKFWARCNFVVSTQRWFSGKQLLSVCLIRKRLRGGLSSDMTSVVGSLPCEDLVVSGLLLGKVTVQFHDTAL